MKTLLATAALMLMVTTAAHAQATNKPQECIGTLTLADGGYRLADASDTDARRNSLWCDAIIGVTPADPMLSDPKLIRKVLKVCPLGTLCRIKGTFSGRGEFYWTKITMVRNPEEDC